MKYLVNFKPTEKHFNQIEKWLIEEDKEDNDGFYCNWYVIENSFRNNELAIISENNIAIGFVTFQINDLTCQIGILEIRPSYREKYIGRYFVRELFKYLKEQNVLVVSLYCKPEKSEYFWKKIGFANIPKSTYKDNKIWMFKPTIPTLKISEKSENIISKTNETIELWNEKVNRYSKSKPKWKWNLIFKSNSRILKNPIIHPVDSYWGICWKNGNITIEKDEISHFKTRISYYGFIIITQLPKH